MIFPWRKGDDALTYMNGDQKFLCIYIGKIINGALFILKVSS